jgi:hypothetical protein
MFQGCGQHSLSSRSYVEAERSEDRNGSLDSNKRGKMFSLSERKLVLYFKRQSLPVYAKKVRGVEKA